METGVALGVVTLAPSPTRLYCEDGEEVTTAGTRGSGTSDSEFEWLLWRWSTSLLPSLLPVKARVLLIV